MPLEMDYEFGKRAVSAGRSEAGPARGMRRDPRGARARRLETAALADRPAQGVHDGSRHRRNPGEPGKRVAGCAGRSAGSRLPRKPAVEEETADDLRLPARHARGFVLAHVHKGGQTKIYPLPPRVVTLGKGASCDIALSDAGVLELHARLSFREETLRDRRSHARRRHRRQRSARPTPQADSVRPDRAGQRAAALPARLRRCSRRRSRWIRLRPAARPCARVRVAEGSRKGAEFYLGSSPLVIGRHTLANVHLREASVGAFHAQIARTPQGIRLADLLSAARTKVNGVRANRKVLNDGDNISIGPATLAFDLVAPPLGGKADRPTGPAVVEKPDAAPAAKAKGGGDWKLPSEIEVEPASDPFMRRGTKPLRERRHGARAVQSLQAGRPSAAVYQRPAGGKAVRHRARVRW